MCCHDGTGPGSRRSRCVERVVAVCHSSHGHRRGVALGGAQGRSNSKVSRSMLKVSLCVQTLKGSERAPGDFGFDPLGLGTPPLHPEPYTPLPHSPNSRPLRALTLTPRTLAPLANPSLVLIDDTPQTFCNAKRSAALALPT